VKPAISLAVALLATVAPLDTSVAQGPDPRSALDSIIRTLEDRERLAVLREDVAALEGLWSEHLIVNNPQNTISPDRATVVALVRRGRIRYSRFERRIEAIRFYDDLVVVMGSETIVRRGERDSVPTPIERRFSHVWRRQGGEWRLIARHANVITPG